VYKFAVLTDNSESVRITVGRHADSRGGFAYLEAQVFQQVIVRFRGVTAEKYVACVVDGGHLDSSLAQGRIRLTARGAPHGIENNLNAGFPDGVEIDDFAQADRYMRADRSSAIQLCFHWEFEDLRRKLQSLIRWHA